MKKRIISMLLTVLMVMSLFSGLTVTADAANYNGANVIEYTMAQGDFVLRICQRLGLNYYTCKNAIMILNNITDGQWNKLTVGRTLTLPASDYDALLISNGAGTSVYNSGAASTTATTSNVTGTATVGNATVFNTAAAVAAASSDTLAYYLVPYTMSYGETVSGVCNALGVNFAIFSPFIKQVNNISSWNRVRAGDTLIIPTPVAPSVGTTCYGVMEHIVAGSDTAYGIVSSKGVNYNANERLLKVLNQTDNLAAIKAGGKFFYPVPLTVSVPGTGNPGATSTTTTTTTVTDGNGTTTTSTTTTAKLYKLSSGMAASDGQMLFYVDNKPVTAAPAGAKVTIVTQANSGKAIQRLTVKHANGTADLLLAGDAFVMPSCDVRVDAVIKNGHDINIAANYSGKATASVGGVSVQAAVKGATVVIKSTDPNYEISSVYATYKKMISSSTKVQLTVSASKAFIMPDADVDVEVVLKPVSTYAFYVNDPANGSFYLQVDGSPVTRAAKGAQVTVVAKPDTGYEPLKMTVKNHLTGAAVNVFSNTFTMPAFDVDVEVEFTGKGNNILVMPSQLGNVYAFDKNTGITDASQFVTEAETGKEIYLVAINEDGDKPVGLTDGGSSPNSKISYDVVRNSDGLKVKVTKGGDDWTMNVDGTSTTSSYYKFTMPKGGVTVTPVITSSISSEIWARIYVNNTEYPGEYKDCSISVTWNGKTSEFTKSQQTISTLKAIKSTIPEGEYIDVRYDSADGVAFVKYKITSDQATTPERKLAIEEATNEANRNGYFKMPGFPINIEAYFETGKASLGPAVVEGVGSVGYKVYTKVSDFPPTWEWRSVNTCEPGDKVMIVVTAGNGYKFDATRYDSKLLVTRKDNGAAIKVDTIAVPSLDPNSFAFTFEMPASGVDVRAIFDPKPFTITMKCQDQVGNDLTGLGLWQIAINMVPGVVDNTTGGIWKAFETKFDVAYGDYVTVAMTEAGWSKYDMVSFRIDGYQYTADELNYFYNFQMIEERAKDLTITAVLRPRVANSPTPHRLIATYLPNMGDVEFFLFRNNPFTGGDEGTGYASNVDGVNYYARVDGTTTRADGTVEYSLSNTRYTSYAFAGDYVAVVVNSNNGEYTADVNNISIVPIQGDADHVVPTPMLVSSMNGDTNGGKGYKVFVFRMPDDDLSINVNFTGKKYGMSIVVVDRNGNPVGGMIDMYVETSIFTDVAANSTFGDVSFNQLVTIMPSARAQASRIGVYSVDVKTDPGAQSVYYYDNSMAHSGPVFNMPASDVIVYITVDDIVANTVNVINLQHMLEGGSLVIRSGPAMTDPVLLTVSGNRQVSLNVTEFSVGDDIYVFEVPDAGKAHLGKGDLGITNNGIVYTVANWHGETADGTNIWKVKVPAGLMVFTATWGDPAEVVDPANQIYAPAEYSVGAKLSFDQTSNAMANPTTTYKTGTSNKLYIGVTPDSGYDAPTAEDIIVMDSEGNKLTVYGSVTPFYVKGEDLKDGGISVAVNCPLKKVSIKFVLASDSPASAKLTLNGVDQFVSDTSGKSYDLDPGTVITISSGNSAYNTVTVVSPKYGKAENKTSQNYVVPDAAETVTITLTSTAPAVTVKEMTNGTVNLRKTNSVTDPTDTASNFKAGEKIFIQAAPAYGYKLKSLKVVENVDSTNANKCGAMDSTSGLYPITSTGGEIPVGGITISAEFEPETIALSFTTNAVGAVDGVVVANVSTGNGLGKGAMTVNTTFGQTITIIPADGFEWSTNAITVTDCSGGKVDVSGTSDRGTRSFKIENIDTSKTYTIVLNLQTTE